MVSELKPCPFCGNKNISVITDSAEYSLGLTDSAYFNVVCSMNSCGCGASSGWYSNREETIEAWNRRTK